jgi:SAM-dependent methyltransferase
MFKSLRLPNMKDYSHIQYGCGLCAPPSWRNFDASPTLRIERVPVIGRLFTRKRVQFPKEAEYGDIVRGLPVPPGSCQAVYCSHVLEHLAVSDFRVALRNTNRILKEGGAFRLVVPDLEYLARKYLNDPLPTGASTFMAEASLGCKTRNRNLVGILTSYWGNSQHLWMWDFKSIQSELTNAGFDQIRKAYFNDSADPRFIEVEDKSRWENCLGVECKKTG